MSPGGEDPLQVLAFDPEAGTMTPWDGGSLLEYRFFHSAAEFEGKLIVAGGANIGSEGPVSTNSSEIFDPASGRFVRGPEMMDQRLYYGGATLGQRVLLYVLCLFTVL